MLLNNRVALSVSFVLSSLANPVAVSLSPLAVFLSLLAISHSLLGV